MLDEGGKETGRAGEKGICTWGEGTGTGDALGDEEVGCWGGRGKRDGARVSTSGTGSENMGGLGGERCEFGTEAGGLGMGKSKGSGGESGSGKLRVKGGIGWMGEGAEEELGCIVGHEVSGVVWFVAIGMEVEGERGV